MVRDYVEAIRQLAAYTERQERRGRLARSRSSSSAIGLGEYLAQMLAAFR